MTDNKFYNLPNKDLTSLSFYEKARLIAVFIDRCESLGVDPDELYLVDTKDPKEDQLKYMISFLTIYNNMLSLYDYDIQILVGWFHRSLSAPPFSHKAPFSLIKGSMSGILKTRLYTNGLRVYLTEVIGNDRG